MTYIVLTVSRRASLKFTILLTLLLYFFPAAGSVSSAVSWLEKYYSNRGVCVSSASVAEITENENTLVVHLSVDTDYLRRLRSGGGLQLVNEWLALHCPLPMEAYNRIFAERDVVVVSSGTQALSCRQFEDSRSK